MLELIDQIEYDTQYPPIQEFQEPWIHCAQCSQGQCVVIGEEGKPAISEGFSKCQGLILLNVLTREALVTHVEPLYMRPQTERKFRMWLQDQGADPLAVLQVLGDQSMKTGDPGTYMARQAEPCSWEILRVPSGGYHWGFAYLIENDVVAINSKDPNVLTVYNWIPDCEVG